jgi:inner membrane protein
MASPEKWNFPLLRTLLIVFLVLLLQIPVLMISGVISERESTRAEAMREVTAKWGDEQSIIGPKLVVPYLKRWVEETTTGSRMRSEVRYAHFLPNTLTISGRVASEVRYRGIFEVPVYRLDLEVSGDFEKPDFSDWDVESDAILWERSHLVVKISDARSIQEQTSLSWNGSEIGFLPGPGESEVGNPGIHALLAGLTQVENSEFSFPLSLNGSVGVFFVPFGRETTVQLESTWSDPSFQGSWLPTDRSIDQDGFQSTWRIPSLGRNQPGEFLRWAGTILESGTPVPMLTRQSQPPDLV